MLPGEQQNVSEAAYCKQ